MQSLHVELCPMPGTRLGKKHTEQNGGGMDHCISDGTKRGTKKYLLNYG